MDAGIRFLVPRRSDGGVRDTLWDHCRRHWSRSCPDIPIHEGASPEGPFNRAAAINDAARGDWAVGVVLDADVLGPPEQVYAAVERACATGRATLAFDRFVGLNQQMTHRVLDGYQGPWEPGARYHSKVHESSIVAIPRALWDAGGGFDERFVGWGQEDVAFIQTCRILGGGIERVPGVVFHLEHGLRTLRGRGTPQYRANQALGQRYRRATTIESLCVLLGERGMKSRAIAFESIWRRNAWHGTETNAGPGSSLAATAAPREHIPRIVADLGVSSVLDAGCADSAWMPDLPGYIGVDIIRAAIKQARERHPARTYRVADICSDDLPQCEAIICRDALQHLSLRDGMAALNNFRRSGAKWLIASTHEGMENIDVPSGGYYPCNLEAEPFWLTDAVQTLDDGTWQTGVQFPHKRLKVWEL
jgi:hypothetical protein